jgi:hypothetical protein
VARFKVLAAKYKFYWFTALMFCTGIVLMLLGVTFPRTIALVVLLGAIFTDQFTTYKCLKLSGREGNPVVAFAMRKISVWGTFMVSACIWALYIRFMWMNSQVNVQTAIALTYWLVPVNNILVLRRLNKVKRVIAVQNMNA